MSVGGQNLNNIILIGVLGLGILAAVGYWLINKRTLANRQERSRLAKPKLRSSSASSRG